MQVEGKELSVPSPGLGGTELIKNKVLFQCAVSFFANGKEVLCIFGGCS